MTLVLEISAATTDAELETIPFPDMRASAIDLRDMAAAVRDEQGDITRAKLHDIDGVTVLWVDACCYGYVNGMSMGVLPSFEFDETDQVRSPEEAAHAWNNPA